jgi:serine/threonine protein kinase
MPDAPSVSNPIVTVPLRAWSTQTDFKIKELLTKGSYGKVYLASHVNTGRDLIVKVRSPSSLTLFLVDRTCTRISVTIV